MSNFTILEGWGKQISQLREWKKSYSKMGKKAVRIMLDNDFLLLRKPNLAENVMKVKFGYQTSSNLRAGTR